MDKKSLNLPNVIVCQCCMIEFGFFKCFAENIAETKDFNCTTTCIPIIYEPLRDWMDQAIPRCETTAEENCMLGLEMYKKYMQLKSTCLKVST